MATANLISRSFAVVCCLATGLVPAPGYTAVPVEGCSVQVATHSFERDVLDLGNGVTSRIVAGGHLGVSVGSALVVTSCRSGRFLKAEITSKVNDPYTGNLVSEADNSIAVKEEFERALASDTSVTFEQLAKRLEQRNVPVRIDASSEETCACAMRYPHLRGTKERYVAQ